MYLVGVNIFDSVWFLSKKLTKINFEKLKNSNQNQFKPIGFGSVRFFNIKTGKPVFSFKLHCKLSFKQEFINENKQKHLKALYYFSI